MTYADKELPMKFHRLVGLCFGFFLLAVGITIQAQEHPLYTVVDLGALPGSTFSQSGEISETGVIAGLSIGKDGNQHPVLWIGRHIFDLSPFGTQGVNAQAFGVNSAGVVSVQAESLAADPNGEDFCAYGTHRQCKAAFWHGGKIRRLPTLGGNNSTVGNVNAFGVISGVAETRATESDCLVPFQTLGFEGVLWRPDGRVRALRPLSGDTVSLALWVNNKGQATGASGFCSNTALPPLAFGPHAVMWDTDGSVHDLGNLGSEASNAGLAINNLGQVVGASSLQSDSTPFYKTDGFLWSKEHGMVDLGTLAGDVASGALGINDRTEVTGLSADASGNPRAVYWRNGKIYELNTIVPADSPMYLLVGQSINDRGEITGFGVVKATGDIHAFRAIPTRGETREAVER
jgi:probable HAF family extracellular repeat protein